MAEKFMDLDTSGKLRRVIGEMELVAIYTESGQRCMGALRSALADLEAEAKATDQLNAVNSLMVKILQHTTAISIADGDGGWEIIDMEDDPDTGDLLDRIMAVINPEQEEGQADG